MTESELRVPSSGLDVRPMSGHIGAEIIGVDLASELSDEVIAKIRSTLLRWKVVFFRDQAIGDAEHVAFARRFGAVTPAHPYAQRTPDGFPEVLPVDRRKRVDQGADVYDESTWHTDLTALVNPPAASILRAEVVPPYGGDTTWTNLVAAYQGLPSPLQRLADELRAQHTVAVKQAKATKLQQREPNVQGAAQTLAERLAANPLAAVHPVVRVHPETGERALFVSPGFTDYIVDFPPKLSERILDCFFEQISRPEYTVRFQWRPGSVAFWDNRATAHLGPSDLKHLDVDRVLYRVTIAGDIPVGPDGRPSELISGRPFEGIR